MARLTHSVVLVSCIFVTYAFANGNNDTTSQSTVMSDCSQGNTKELDREKDIVNDADNTTNSVMDPDIESVFRLTHLAQVKNNPCQEGYFRDWLGMCRKLDTR
ncbi:unnamed protein product [Acanthoscelides obtectus]|uniref:Uncharacterized protein n=1 Tax=Acanthoscelides obtectus TaxID=200917 RepID=A0A9P0MB02_ACAOB|nr:unnamed protein product [Acanthoscelides obtectus]CAK1643865.1 hypothetical protein AOBTE_LOCUS13712 [Acanthoscelides obtectus]